MKKYMYLKPFLKKIRGKLFTISMLSIGIAIVQLITPYVTKVIFDLGICRRDKGVLINNVVILILLYTINTMLKVICNFSFTKMSNMFIVDVQKEVYRRVMHMPIPFFDKNETGYIMSRLSEVSNLNMLFSPIIMNLFISAISFCGAIIMITKFSVILTGYVFMCIPVLYILSRFSAGKIKKSSVAYSEAAAKASGNLEENISGIRELKGLNAETKRVKTMQDYIKDVAEKAIRRSNSTIFGSEMTGLFANISNAVFTLIAGFLILGDHLSIGGYIALASYVGQVFAPIQQFSMFALSVQPGIVTLSRLGIFWENEIETEIDGEIELEKVKSITFKNVGFRYPKTKKDVVYNLSFDVCEREKVAILGENGAGKSTIAKLLLGFYKNYQGEIYFNDTELRQLDIHALRKKISMVSQKIFLFSGTIEENITMGEEDIEKEELNRIIKKCGLTELVEKSHTDGFRINEGGKNLSGGQIQKIAIARSLIRKSDIFILDEVNNNLDEAARESFYNMINDTLNDKIVFIITHDPEVYKVVNQFILIQEGRGIIQDREEMNHAL